MIISKGNMKIGKMSNVSLTPIKSCNGCADHCGKSCYAMKAYIQYPTVKHAWDHNYDQAINDRHRFFSEIVTKLKKYKGEYFRWHVGGDILDAGYYEMMLMVADSFPKIKFLAFTKQYTTVNSVNRGKPKNFSLVFSAWPGMEMDNPYGYPVAWMQDKTETRVPEGAIECPGSCETCSACWGLAKAGFDVVFHKH